MIYSILKCMACSAPPHFDFFPLCEICGDSLVACPPLCSNCTRPDCGDSCSRPWSSAHPVLSSVSARYLLLGRGYSVLKAWKKSRGRFFDQRILTPHAPLTQAWLTASPTAIVAIPQSYSRAWQMRGSPAERVARWVSQETGLPVISALLPSPLPRFLYDRGQARRQAELSLFDRIQNPLRFLVDESQLSDHSRILLVDDFHTTGHTLRMAAQQLERCGVSQVHAFTLGLRLPRIELGPKPKLGSQLLESA